LEEGGRKWVAGVSANANPKNPTSPVRLRKGGNTTRPHLERKEEEVLGSVPAAELKQGMNSVEILGKLKKGQKVTLLKEGANVSRKRSAIIIHMEKRKRRIVVISGGLVGGRRNTGSVLLIKVDFRGRLFSKELGGRGRLV